MEARLHNHCCRGKAVSVENYESVSVILALVIYYPKPTRRIILSYVACLVLIYFSTLSHKSHDFLKKKKLLNK
jgi:hypothetical protein